MKVDCPKRTERRAKGNIRATARDLLVLSFIAQAQPVHTGQVRRFMGASPDMARRRLRVLRDLGLVQVYVVAMEAANRYTLTRRGQAQLVRTFSGNAEDYPAKRGLGRANLEHHDGQVDLFVALQVATARSKQLDLDRFLFEREIRKQVGTARGVLVPDAIATFTDRNLNQFAVVLEVDLGTENPSWFSRHKAIPYCEKLASGQAVLGCHDWRVACVVPSRKRLRQLVKASWEAGMTPGSLYFAVASDLTDCSILKSGWMTTKVMDGGKVARLVPDSPFQTVITKGHNRDDCSPVKSHEISMG